MIFFNFAAFTTYWNMIVWLNYLTSLQFLKFKGRFHLQWLFSVLGSCTSQLQNKAGRLNDINSQRHGKHATLLCRQTTFLVNSVRDCADIQQCMQNKSKETKRKVPVSHRNPPRNRHKCIEAAWVATAQKQISQSGRRHKPARCDWVSRGSSHAHHNSVRSRRQNFFHASGWETETHGASNCF